MGRKSVKRCNRTFELNDEAVNDDNYSRCSGNGGDNRGSDELVFDETILQELKGMYKRIKREVLKCADSTKADVESSKKWKPTNIQFKEEEPDLEEPICCRKSRLLKQPKVDTRWAEKCSSSCHPESVGSEKPEQEGTLLSVCQDSLVVALPRTSVKCEHFLYNSEDLCGANSIKTEIIETKSSILQNAARFADSATFCFAKMNLSCELSSQLLERVDASVLESGKSNSFSENMEGFSQTKRVDVGELEMRETASFSNELVHCSLNEASIQYFEDTEDEESTDSIVNLSGESSDGLPDRFDGVELDMRGSTSFTDETLHCSVNEASIQYMDETGESNSSTANVDLCSELSNGLFKRVDGTEFEIEESKFCFAEESLHCCVNEVSTEYMEEMEESTYFIAKVGLSGESSDGFPDLEMEESSYIEHESLPCPNEASTHCLEPGGSTFLHEIAESHGSHPHLTSQLTVEGVPIPEISAGSSEAMSAFNNPGSEVYGNSISFSSSQEILCQMHSNLVTQVSDMAVDDSVQCMESNGSSYGRVYDLENEGFGDIIDEIPIDGEMPTDGSKDDTSTDHEDHSTRDTNDHYRSCQDSQHIVTVSNSFPSFDDHSPLTVGILSSSIIEETRSASADEAGKSSTGICPSSNGTEGLTAIESFDNFYGEKLERPPERLLSTRKVIPLTSQEILRQGIGAEELYESIQISNYRRRLWFEKRTKASTTGAGLMEGKIMKGHNGIVKKLNNINDGSRSSVAEDVFTSPDISCMESCTCSRCSLNHANAQKAIRFSQQQMHDMECFVMKLLKGLKPIKNITEGQLFTSAFSTSKDRVGEMRKAALDAVRLEETARKWHSTMTKDWNRFCRIMNLSNGASTNSSVRNRQKKVIFADEAGGVLCHVKVFEKNPGSAPLRNGKT